MTVGATHGNSINRDAKNVDTTITELCYTELSVAI